MKKTLIIAVMNLFLVSAVFAEDGACESAMDKVPCEKESCQAEPVAENNTQAEVQSSDCKSCTEASN